jgi:electron-transferring-flavoprotein dehydrogenase
MERIDVAVVGGGPAGTCAAWEAAKAGADAVLVEKGVPRADRDGLGPDSTDAAGMLDYWIDIMDFDPAEIPDEVVLQELDAVDFVGPSESVTIETTGIDATYDRLGYTFHRARMDDWLRERAEAAGAEYRIGTGVRDVETDLEGGHTHTLTLADGDQLEAEYLVLADGPQRTVTNKVLDRFMPRGQSITDYLASTKANHIAYQEHRRFPAELFEENRLKFWWGWMPGETAYPWVFPNDDTVARVGLTMPIGMELEDVDDPASYRLLREDDDGLPRAGEYVTRLLEELYGDEYDIEADFPLVEDRGKATGTETYPISSTRPIESPTRAGIAVAGGAMGTTSAFHEGGYHVAVRSGKLAGQLAAQDQLTRYNHAWRDAIGEELRRNVTFADMVAEYTPRDWDHVFRTANGLLSSDQNELVSWNLSAGIAGARLLGEYKYRKFGYRDGRYAQVREADYTI